ncbi:Hsp70 family protein [Corynebacterium sp. NPDC060344]|uniref:Hsp70 family protein n=1 Tax=Corynebacterium sp. NPDC060344 TaxID=3347101 RepID=UPI003648CDB5
MSGWRLAIDFGTSNTAAAHRAAAAGQGGAPAEALALSHHGNLLPSAVFADGQGLMVGHVALNQAESQPDAFLPEPKRAVGSETVLLAGTRMPVAEVIGAVIGSVLDRARRFAGGSMPDDVVLTHPEGWGNAELMRLIDGAERAGIERRRLSLVSEPRAATYWYSFQRPLSPGQKVAVFDLGGGTLDVAVLTPTADGSLQVIAARGDNSLGGRTLDARIRSWVEAELEENDTELLRALRSGASGSSLALDRAIKTAKEVLSEAPRATITVAAQGRESTLMLTRGEFEELIKPDVDRALDVTRATLLDAGLRPDPSTALYLTGGSARIPYIQDRLGELCQVATLDDPKTVVSRGALMGPTRRAEDVAAGVTTWIAPGSVAGGAGSMAVAPVPPTPQSAPSSQSPQPQMPQQPYYAAPNQGGPANPYGAQQHAQTQPQQAQQQPQQFAAVPSSSGSKSGNSKMPLFAIGGVVALLLIGRAWALMSDGDDNGGGNGGNGGGETTATETSESQPAAAPWPDPMIEDSDRIKTELTSRLPSVLVEQMDNCSPSETVLSVGLGSDRFPSYLCGYEYPESQETGLSTAQIITSAEAIEAVGKYADKEGTELIELSSSEGRRVLLEENDTFAYFYVHSPQGSYLYRSGHFDSGEKARTYLKQRDLI